MGRALTAFTCAFLAIGGFLFGYDSGIISSTIAQPHFVDYFSNPSSAEKGGIVAVFAGGAILGALTVFKLGDWLGRKKTVFTGGTISVLGCALQAGAATIPMLIAGRFIAGIAVGILSAMVPMYCAEVAEARYRGALAGLLQWMISWGFFAAQWIGYGSTYSDTDFQWRFPLAFQVVPGLMLMVGVWFLCESPRWLVEQDRHDEAKAVLHKLHYNGSNEELVELEYCEIRDVILADRANINIKWSSIFTKKSWRRRLFLGAGVQAFCQLSGINVFSYYGPTVYKILGIDIRTALEIIGINGTLGILETTACLWLLERVGRRIPLIGSAALMGVTLLINAVMAAHIDYNNGNMLRAMVAMNFAYQLFFTPTGTISWVYQSEIFPTEIRAQGNSLCTFTNWTLNVILSQVSPIALQHIGFKFFYFFMAWNIIATTCYWLFYPETKGKTLEQMDEVFGDQIVPHALEQPEEAAKVAREGSYVNTVEISEFGKNDKGY